jgi:UDP-GlcNAc:undecaprenyl-phosphate GlcNAc-1-phosphate transferase
VAALAISGACLAFLRYNFYPARVFMGDSGSLLLGFALGVVSLFGVVRAPTLITLFVPVIIAGIPVIDTFSAILRRLRARRPIASADTDHMHHRLIDYGFDQRTTVIIMYALSAFLAVCAILVTQYGRAVVVMVAVVLLVLTVLLIYRLGLTSSVLTHYYRKREPHTRSDDGQDG